MTTCPKSTCVHGTVPDKHCSCECHQDRQVAVAMSEITEANMVDFLERYAKDRQTTSGESSAGEEQSVVASRESGEEGPAGLRATIARLEEERDKLRRRVEAEETFGVRDSTTIATLRAERDRLKQEVEESFAITLEREAEFHREIDKVREENERLRSRPPGIGDGDIQALFDERDALRAENERLKAACNDTSKSIATRLCLELGLPPDGAAWERIRTDVYAYGLAMERERNAVCAKLARAVAGLRELAIEDLSLAHNCEWCTRTISAAGESVHDADCPIVIARATLREIEEE